MSGSRLELGFSSALENFEAVAVKEFKRLNLPVTEIDPESLHEWLPSKLSPELLDDPIIPRPMQDISFPSGESG